MPKGRNDDVVRPPRQNVDSSAEIISFVQMLLLLKLYYNIRRGAVTLRVQAVSDRLKTFKTTSLCHTDRKETAYASHIGEPS